MIRRILNTPNDKRNEIVAKIKREKFESIARCHNIKFETAKTKITRLVLNNYDCHVF